MEAMKCILNFGAPEFGGLQCNIDNPYNWIWE